jgi:hypothetical protein
VSVECINRKLGVCVMVGGHVWPVKDWLDRDGNDCAEPDAAFAVVGPCSDENRPEFWVTLYLDAFNTIGAVS